MHIQNEQIIQIEKQISKNLALRDRANELFEMIEADKHSCFVIDFSNVESISRSFAQEFITRKNESKKNIDVINVPDNVRRMFELIKMQKNRVSLFDRKSIRHVCL